MAQTVLPVGGVPYTAEEFDDLFEALSTRHKSGEQGPIKGLLNELAVTGTSSPLSVATGWAFVKGKLYKSTAAESVAIPTPTTHPRIDRVVLRLDFQTNPITCVVARLAGTEAASPTAPALTQTDGTLWEISLARAQITTTGAVTVTDEREFVGDDLFEGLDAATLEGNPASAFAAATHVTATSVHSATSAATANRIMLRDASGRARAASPSHNDDVANKGYVDSAPFAPSSHVTDTSVHSATSAATANRIMMRDASGRARAAAPSHNDDVATKSYVDSAVIGGLPAGIIMMWSGSVATIPAGFALCDGSSGTPDLRDRFVIAAGGTHNPGATGGAASHDLAHTHATSFATSTDGEHSHTNPATAFAGLHSHALPTELTAQVAGEIRYYLTSTATGSTGSHQHTQGDTGSAVGHNHAIYAPTGSSLGVRDNRPPFYALAFIMKL